MITIGITGGIGSGKSTVCKVFRLLGIPIFEADVVAKELINSNSEIKTKLIHLFGEEIYIPNEGVDRKKLANIIFNDNIQLAKVNELVHPVVRNEFENWVKKQNTPYIIHEAAILFESGFYKMMDFTILVSAPESQRVERVIKRDGTSEKQVKERMEKQWSDAKKKQLASVEIKNADNDLIIPQVVKIDTQINRYGKIW
jgi:dephospho-CoA kinase